MALLGFEIFDCLDGYDIYKAFSNLNIRLENLLISSSLSMKIDISSNTIFDFHYKQFLKSNKHHIISFDIDSQSTLDKFMNLLIIDSLFSRLESLTFNSISTYKLLIILFHLKSSPYLSSSKFDEFEEFLLKLCSPLQLCDAKIESRDRSYFNADRWERFISQNMTSLIRFIFRYSDIIDDEFELTFYHSLINRFTSSFWI
ncbi:unnamed protein product, partial [Rotaria magnacalcarata]